MKSVLRCALSIVLGVLLVLSAGCMTDGFSSGKPTPIAATESVPENSAAADIPPTLTASIPAGDPDYYYVMTQNSCEGVVNGVGEVVLPFDYEKVNIISHGITPEAFFAASTVNDAGPSYEGMLYGLSGQCLSNKTCRYAVSLCEGRICYWSRDGQYGVITNKGLKIVPPCYDDIEMCGTSIVASIGRFEKEKTVDIYEIDGTLVNSANLKYLGICGDMILVSDETGKYVGLVDTRFEQTIPAKFSELKSAGNGLFIARRGEKYGVIDTKGKTVVPFRFNNITDGSDADQKPLFIATNGNDKAVFDNNGKQLLKSEQFVSLVIENGMILGQDIKGLYRYIDFSGKDIIPPATTMTIESGQYILRSYSGVTNCYTKNGEKIPIPVSISINIVGKDRLIFSSYDTYMFGLCDAEGTILVPAQYAYLSACESSDDLFYYSTMGTEHGILDLRDGSAWDNDFETLYDAGGGLFYAENGERHGLVDKRGRWVWQSASSEPPKE